MSTIKEDDLFQSSHLTLLVSYTIFAAILVVESFLMGWELWALLLVAGLLFLLRNTRDEHI